MLYFAKNRNVAEFQSTLPLWGATAIEGHLGMDIEISIHAPLVGSDPGFCREDCVCGISIHAPLVGSDFKVYASAAQTAYFNPRSPCGERLGGAETLRHDVGISIHAPLVGSDGWTYAPHRVPPYFNPRSPCGERPAEPRPPRFKTEISIHAPLVGSDRMISLSIAATLSISIHAPLVGSDRGFRSHHSTHFYFNPRSPCGERLG